MVTLDSTGAWHSARRMVSANRDMLVAIAGVFFLLPGLIEAVILPSPQIGANLDQQQAAGVLVQFYSDKFPLLLLLSLPMLLGFLTVLAVLLDRERPTVGAAIALGARLLPSYLAAQMLTALVLSILWMTVFGALTLILPQAIAVLFSLLVMIYPLVRVVLIGPEMVAQRLRNPIRAIAGGLSRTRGQFLAILLYFGPALTLFVVIYGLAMIFTRMALVNLADSEVQRVISEVISAILASVFNTYFAAMVASTYDQLGPINGTGAAISPSNPN